MRTEQEIKKKIEDFKKYSKERKLLFDEYNIGVRNALIWVLGNPSKRKLKARKGEKSRLEDKA